MRLKWFTLSAALLVSMAQPVGAATIQTISTSTPYCREYTQHVSVGGRVENSYGTACMQPDGSWETQAAQEPQVNATIQQAGYYYNYGTPAYVAPYPVYQQPVYAQPQPLVGFNFGYVRPYRYHDNYRFHGHDHRRWRGHDRHDHDDWRGGWRHRR